MAGAGPGVPAIAPPVGDGAPAAPSLPALNFKQRQALPLTSQGVAPGSSGYYENKLSRIEDQQANPLGSAENHPGALGKIGHVLGTIGNKALDVTGINTVPGTEANTNARKAWDTEQLDRAQSRETQAKQQAATEAYQTGELGVRQQAEKREQQTQDYNEAKPLSPETESLEDLKGRINPKTGKLYTAEEAEIKRQQDIEDTKPDKNAPEPKTITMLDKPGGKPFQYQYDPKGNYAGDQGYGQWKKVGPAQANAAAMGLVGSLQPIIDPNTNKWLGTFNTKTGERKALTPAAGGENSALNAGATPMVARLGNTERNQFNTQYIKPATDLEQQYQKAQAAVQSYNNNPQTGAAGMVLLASHLGTTLGSVKGATTGEHMVSEHQNAIGLGDRLQRYIDYLQTGQPLSPGQVQEFNNLITETRDISWKVAAKEAARRHQPIDFLPGDMQISMKDSTGKARKVPGGRVQSALDAGAEIE